MSEMKPVFVTSKVDFGEVNLLLSYFGCQRSMEKSDKCMLGNSRSPVLNSTSFLAKMGFTLKALNQQSRYLIEISVSMTTIIIY